MADPEPAAEAMTGLDAAPTSWATARGLLEKTRPAYWLATVRPDGRPLVMPLLGVWVEGRLYFCAGEGTRKARNLAGNSACVVAVEEEPLDLVVEGEAVKTRDEATLRRVADAYAAVYDWHVTVRDASMTPRGPRPQGHPRTTSTK